MFRTAVQPPQILTLQAVDSVAVVNRGHEILEPCACSVLRLFVGQLWNQGTPEEDGKSRLR